MSNDTPMKHCSKCKNEYPKTPEYFNRDRRSRDGLKNPCKQCQVIQHRKYNNENRDAVRQSNHAHYQRNRDYYIEQCRNYQKRNRAAYRANWHRYHARKLSLPSNFSTADWQRCLEYFNHRCAICGKPAGLWHTIAQDHWIPLTDKRPNNPGTVPWNIVPLCHPAKDGQGGCNNSKGYKDPEQWLIEQFGKRKGTELLSQIQAYFESVKLQSE